MFSEGNKVKESGVVSDPIIENEIRQEENSGSLADLESNTSLDLKRSIGDVFCELFRDSGIYTANALSINLGSFLNVWLLAELSSKTLAATSLASAIQLVAMNPVKVTLVSTGVIVARNIDPESDHNVRTILQQSWVQSLIGSMPVVIVFLLSEQILLLFGQDSEIAAIAGDYLRKYSITVPAEFLLQSNDQFVLAHGKPELAFISNTFSTFTHAGLTYVLALGNLGSPELGISGSAYASALSSWFALFGFMAYFKLSKSFRGYNLFSFLKNNDDSFAQRKEVSKLLLSVGAPIGFQYLLRFAYSFSRTILAGLLGTTNGLIAEQIIGQYSRLAYSPISAISAIAGLLLGKDISRRRASNVKLIGNTGIAFNAAVIAPVLLLFMSIPGQLTSLFIDSSDEGYDDIQKLMKFLFVINGIGFVFDAVEQGANGALRGFYDTTWPAVIILAALWLVGAPSSYLLAFTADYGVAGLSLGTTLGILAAVSPILKRWNNSANDPEAAIEASKVSLKDMFCGFFHQSNCLPCFESGEFKNNDLEDRKDDGLERGAILLLKSEFEDGGSSGDESTSLLNSELAAEKGFASSCRCTIL